MMAEDREGKGRSPDLGSPWPYPLWALLEVGLLRAPHSRGGQRTRKGTRGREG